MSMFICETTTIIHCSIVMDDDGDDDDDDDNDDDLNLPTTSLSEHQEQIDLALL